MVKVPGNYVSSVRFHVCSPGRAEGLKLETVICAQKKLRGLILGKVSGKCGTWQHACLVDESHAPGIGHVQTYYSSLPVNDKLKAYVNFVDLPERSAHTFYASS